VKISRQEIVVSFEIDSSIVLTCGQAIKNIQKKLGGNILSINTPEDAPPFTPRIILNLNDTIMHLGLDRVHIITIPPSHVSDEIEKSSKFTFQRVNSLLSELRPSIPRYLWAGIISTIEYPEKSLKNTSAIEATTPVFDKLIKIDRKNKELSSFQLQYGIKKDQYFVTYTIGGYDIRNFKLKPPKQPGFYVINPEEYPLMECGIRILLDINNKANKQNNDPINDIEEILIEKKKLVDNILEDLNLKEVLP
jgi:hypothetical protein